MALWVDVPHRFRARSTLARTDDPAAALDLSVSRMAVEETSKENEK
jgi:hypothetical protein